MYIKIFSRHVGRFLFEFLTVTCIEEMLFFYFKIVPALNKVVPKLLKSILITVFSNEKK